MSRIFEKVRQRTAAHQASEQHIALLRPPEKTRKEKIRDFFWDKKNKSCLTRTPINWLAISIYYFLFLAGVILIFYVSMLIAHAVASMSGSKPQYTLGDSWIGSTPALNFFPMKNDRNLLWLSDKLDYNIYVTKISDEFKSYKKINSSYDTEQFANCSNPPYGYKDKFPCLFFRINRLISWEPQPFVKGDKLPEDMPQEVKDKIDKSSTPRIWLTCNGTTAKDRDHMKPEFFSLQGEGGFDVSVYPYRESDNFIDPIVALQIKEENPQKVLYSFICKLWAKELDEDVSHVHVTYYFE